MTRMKGYILLGALLFTASVLLGGSPVLAKEDKTKLPVEEEYPGHKVDEDMKPLRATGKPLTMSYGGWITPVVIDQRESNVELATSLTTAKIWAKSTLWSGSHIYVRVKDDYQAVIKEKNIDLKNENIVDLDVGYISMASEKGAVSLAMGRKFFYLGTGLILNGRGDGAELDIYSGILDLKLMGAYTGLLKKDNNPYGLSYADYSDGARRIFAGGAMEKRIGNQTLYLMGLAQIDRGKEEENTKTRYQSQYYGGGLRGILSDSLDYYGEFVYETGKSYLSGSTEQKDVKAYAGLAGISYFLKTAFNPALILHYAYGSGDKDRNNYKSSTANAADDDTGFLSFGTYIGGYALRPVLGNLHIFRGGFSFVPFYASDYRTLRRLNIEAKYSYYMKDKKEGQINYGEAPFPNKDVGQAVDAALRWGIYYDLAFFANYGLFLPGKAYAKDEKNRHFIMAGFNIVF